MIAWQTLALFAVRSRLETRVHKPPKVNGEPERGNRSDVEIVVHVRVDPQDLRSQRRTAQEGQDRAKSDRISTGLNIGRTYILSHSLRAENVAQQRCTSIT